MRARYVLALVWLVSVGGWQWFTAIDQADRGVERLPHNHVTADAIWYYFEWDGVSVARYDATMTDCPDLSSRGYN
jgi:hypothetical protein